MRKLHPHALPRAFMRAYLATNGGVAHWHQVYQYLKGEGMGQIDAGHAVTVALEEGFLREDGRGFVRLAPPRPSLWEIVGWLSLVAVVLAIVGAVFVRAVWP
jgi:hypothetical protein